MARTVALLRITPTAYAELVECLKLCGDEGLRRIMPDGKHLDVSELMLEVDPNISARFPPKTSRYCEICENVGDCSFCHLSGDLGPDYVLPENR